SVIQRVGALVEKVVQRATTIKIQDEDGAEAQGTSGSAVETSTKLSKWPSIKALVEQHVASQNMPELNAEGAPTGRTYQRDWNFCAEPNALAKLLDTHKDLEDDTVTKDWLDGLEFPAKAVDDKGNSLWPCPVCSQWV